MSYRFNCKACKRKCDGVSKGIYIFKNDVDYSEYFERKIIDKINKYEYVYAKKTQKNQYPDIEIYFSENHKLLCYIEVKVQRRTFMSVQRYLPYSELLPSETLALNQSDLEHYIEQHKNEGVPVYIVWVLSNRPCIVEDGKELLFYNSLDYLQKVFEYYGNSRRFRRKSGVGDVINGEHKGVVVNYHFSLRELIPFDLDKIIKEQTI